MATSRQQDSRGRKARTEECGQAIVEFTAVVLMMLMLALGLIDFGRAIYEKQVITNLTGEGSNLASRGTDFADTITAVIGGAAPLDINNKGKVIVTAVYNNNGNYRITQQLSQGAYSANSRIGQGVGFPATLPITAVPIPQPKQTLYVTEVFYSYQPITPVGKMLNVLLPATMYDAAYF